ncbi:unnamed protein product [Cochlearia groenlandica]
MRHIFGAVGVVQSKSLRLANTNTVNFRGYCHVQYASAEEVIAALGLTERDYNGRRIRVCISGERVLRSYKVFTESLFRF